MPELASVEYIKLAVTVLDNYQSRQLMVRNETTPKVVESTSSVKRVKMVCVNMNELT